MQGLFAGNGSSSGDFVAFTLHLGTWATVLVVGGDSENPFLVKPPWGM